MTMDLFSLTGNEDTSPPQPHVFTVTEITRRIKFLLEEGLPLLVVEGEISNLSVHRSGHTYFTLKDEGAQIRCVLWRSQAEKISVVFREGIKVIVKGRLAVYEKGGVYQIVVQDLQPQGIGALQLALEKLKRKLYDEGLFDPAHKQPVPEFPGTVGVVTSPTGAAIRDIVSVIHRRWPGIRIVLAPVNVQGPGAADEIVGAIRDMERWGQADVLIVGRGGGSLEDLWAFNEERVARAIFACSIPVISAVGHEVDFTIADFVSDVRAATPSAAAELVAPDRSEVKQRLNDLRDGLKQGTVEHVRDLRRAVREIQNHYAFRQPENLVAQYRQLADELDRRLQFHVANEFRLAQQHIANLARHLQNLNPHNTLSRGYTITRQAGRVVSSVQRLTVGEAASIEFADGVGTVAVERKQPARLLREGEKAKP